MASASEPAGTAALMQHLAAIEAASHGPLEERTRKQALALAKSIVSSLEKPEEVVMWYGREVNASGCHYIQARH